MPIITILRFCNSFQIPISAFIKDLDAGKEDFTIPALPSKNDMMEPIGGFLSIDDRRGRGERSLLNPLDVKVIPSVVPGAVKKDEGTTMQEEGSIIKEVVVGNISDDYFARNMYRGEIYKTKNLRNKTLMQLYPDPDDLKHAQDSIEARLASFDKNLWVPSREELQARAEAAEAAAENDSTVVIKNRDNKKKESSSTKRSTKRGQKNTKVKESKQKTTKVKSATVRSVRNRKK